VADQHAKRAADAPKLERMLQVPMGPIQENLSRIFLLYTPSGDSDCHALARKQLKQAAPGDGLRFLFHGLKQWAQVLTTGVVSVFSSLNVVCADAGF
jgi:hypothetical protein